MKISIVIPAYESKGRGIEFLSDLFKSIEQQTYKNYEIIISDHSKNNEIEKFISNCDLNVIHFYNERGIGNSSVNMNEGIKKATGDIIKIMHIDDIFCNNFALELMVEKFKKNINLFWGVMAFNHNYESENSIRRIIIPEVDNAYGCPSVSFFRLNRLDPDFFDENLIVINDHDMHYRLRKKYGDPITIEDVCVTIRMHGGQVSGWIGNETEKKEREYFENKIKNDA